MSCLARQSSPWPLSIIQHPSTCYSTARQGSTTTSRRLLVDRGMLSAPQQQSRRRCRCRRHRPSAAATLQQAEQEILAAVQAIGVPASVFPGDEQQRAGIDAAIQRLERQTPTPSPLSQPDRGGAPSPLLLAEWQLVYASNGTYVTRTAAAQALLAASRLPGVGVSDIRQGLSLQADRPSSTSSDGATSSSGSSSSSTATGGAGQPSPSPPPLPALRTTNAARLGLGPLGDWEVVISGGWAVQQQGGGSLARVTFDAFTLQLVGLLGLIKLPRMLKVTVPVTNSIEADFTTTYLSDSLRVARGRGGNLFLFSKLQ